MGVLRRQITSRHEPLSTPSQPLLTVAPIPHHWHMKRMVRTIWNGDHIPCIWGEMNGGLCEESRTPVLRSNWSVRRRVLADVAKLLTYVRKNRIMYVGAT